MKNVQSKILLVFCALSLVIIGWVFVRGLFTNKLKSNSSTFDIKGVLGEQSNILEQAASDAMSPINSSIQKSIDTAKESVSQKTIEVERKVVETLEKEVTNFSKSQVDNLKFSICRDWGITSLSPTKSP